MYDCCVCVYLFICNIKKILYFFNNFFIQSFLFFFFYTEIGKALRTHKITIIKFITANSLSLSPERSISRRATEFRTCVQKSMLLHTQCRLDDTLSCVTTITPPPPLTKLLLSATKIRWETLVENNCFFFIFT